MSELSTSRYCCRSGEIPEPQPHLRTDRFFSAQGIWYFSTREGASIGPFEDKDKAQRGLDDFIEFMTLARPTTVSKLCASLTEH